MNQPASAGRDQSETAPARTNSSRVRPEVFIRVETVLTSDGKRRRLV
jgi:hypothetical protein